MPPKKQRPPKRWRTKEAREIAETVQKAGGTVELTGKGHLKITGPEGTAIVASAPDTGRQGGRALANTLATIQRETGLRVAPDPAENRLVKGTKDLPGDRPPPVRTRQDRQGEITRWKQGDTYGFVTSDDDQSWFVSRDSLPDGLRELPEGTQVTFSGSPKPKPGKPYPETLRVQVVEHPARPTSSDG
jgi:cold shock CspA family protein